MAVDLAAKFGDPAVLTVDPGTAAKFGDPAVFTVDPGTVLPILIIGV